MCGITGYIDFEHHDHKAMIASLHHRGPDSCGHLMRQYKDRNICLGHARLRIIDLSENGAQPMSTDNDMHHIAYNGEVYNFQELRQKHLAGQRLKSETDTEVLLYLYKKLGMDFLQHLNGAFAMTILDEESNKLYLIRDRVGIKPLYYSLQGERLIFGSEIKPILKAGVPAKVAKNQIQRFFVFKYVPGNDTLFEGIKRLPPGHFLEYDLESGNVVIEQYWAATADPDIQKLSYKDAQAQCYDLMQKAVEHRLIADVPISTFLSGGLDSSIIAHFLKDNDQITHYCAAKEEKDIKAEGTTSDIHFAQKLAAEWNLDFARIPIGSDELTNEMVSKTIHFSDDLIADGSQIPSYLITKSAAEHCRVVLTGMGADELFLGYAGHQITLLSQKMDKLPGFIGGSLNKRMARIEAGKGKFKAFKRYLFKMGKYHDFPAYKYGIYSIIGDYNNSLSVFGGEEDTARPFLEQYFKEDQDPFDSLHRFEQDNFMVKNLHYVDRTSMANSLESRVPFLDHNVVQFAHNLPRAFKLSTNGKSKRILKDTFSPHLPKYITQRRKAGFGMPLRSIFSDEGKVNDLVDLDFYSGFDGFSTDAIQLIIKEHLTGATDNSSILYALVSFRAWHQLFI
jgi:asparagine synthase (glutamine-hydrolysing)